MRDKLIELMEHSVCESGACLSCEHFNDIKNCIEYQKKARADYLIANGVTFAADNNVGDKCDYCQEFSDPCGVPMIAAEDSDPDRGIYLYNGFLCASGGEFCEARVRYCPMCGRKLSEPQKEGEA